MTGKGCVYTEQIDREIELRRDTNNGAGFTVIPFKPNSAVFYELCLRRYVEGAYQPDNGKMTLIRADQVRKTGYVVCDKICKKIQESDYIVADVSVPNANVFYELGLAYGIDQKIILVRHKKSEFGSEVEKYFRCKIYSYDDLNPLRIEEFPLSTYIWKRGHQYLVGLKPTMLLIDKLNYPTYEYKTDINQDGLDNSSRYPIDISLTFSDHVGAAVGVAIDSIISKISASQQSIKIPETYYSQIKMLRDSKAIARDAPFQEILSKVEESFCAIIKTGGEYCNPMMYFWLGYCHARGKNVIPITIVDDEKSTVDDLAFDIRALWHMSFLKNNPRLLEGELEETLHQMIITDFSEWSRRRFWDEVLDKRGKVSIFTGALHNPIGREMIGDWDLRAASELTSYFAQHQYRATIESPVYQIEQVVPTVTREEYISELKNMLHGKNCVIIASPDVNPLTEMVLGKIYDIEKINWFGSANTFDAKRNPDAVIAFKGIAMNDGEELQTENVRRTFYEEIPDLEKGKRGFSAAFLSGGKIEGGFVSQEEEPKEFTVHAHLAIIPNPYRDQNETKFIIILNGVSGPATFALTHVLSGGVSNEFVSYEEGFDPSSKSESILQQILEDMSNSKAKRQQMAFQYIVSVKVGAPKDIDSDKKRPRKAIFDWRHIRSWKLVKTHDFTLHM